MATRGAFSPTTWVAGAAPGISAPELQRIEDQIAALDAAWTGSDELTVTDLVVSGTASIPGYLALSGGSMSGDLTFDSVLTGFDYQNQGLALNLGSKDVADDGAIPFIDFYSGSSVIAARIITSTDSGSNYSGTLTVRAAELSVEGHVRASVGHNVYGDRFYFTGVSETDSWIMSDEDDNLMRFYIDNGERMRLTSVGDLYISGDQLYFGMGSNDYISHSEVDNYFRFVIDGDEIWRVTTSSNSTYMDLQDTGSGVIRNREGGHLYIRNDVTDQDIIMQTYNGGGSKNRMFIDGSANEIYWYNHDGTTKMRLSDNVIYSYDSANGDYTGFRANRSTTNRFTVRIDGVDRYAFTYPVSGGGGSLAPLADNARDLGAPSLRWDDVYATNGTIQTSDERFKSGVKALDDQMALSLIEAIEPIQFKWPNGSRFHWSFGAAQLRDAMKQYGYDPADFGVFIDPTKGNKPIEPRAVPGGKDEVPDAASLPLGLRQHEMFPLLWSGTQQLVREQRHTGQLADETHRRLVEFLGETEELRERLRIIEEKVGI